MEKVKEIVLSILIAVFAMAAGAACYHQYVHAAAQDKPVIMAEPEVAPVQREIEATAYCYGTTRCDGQPVRQGICAGKPEWYGKVAAVYENDGGTPGKFLGYFEILDTGGDERIKNGTVLDIYLPDYDACIEFGRQDVIVVLIDGEG